MHKMMNMAADIAVGSVLEAIKMIRAEEKPKAVLGEQSAQFFELEIAPETSDLVSAQAVAEDLLKSGIGIKVSVNWQYGGSHQWSIKTADMKVINRGL